MTLALGMPANERMDTLVEKATELGVAAVQPLMCERSVLRLAGERARKKVAHWQARGAWPPANRAAARACRTIAPVRSLHEWLAALAADAAAPRSACCSACASALPLRTRGCTKPCCASAARKAA